MIAVSASYQQVCLRRAGKIALTRIRYKRRYWNGSAFVYEANWQILKQNQYSKIGQIPMNLDTQFRGVYKSTTITLVLNNLKNQWQQGATSGSVFAADAVATNGYIWPDTLFQIQYGLILPDLSTEWCTQFTGVMIDWAPTDDRGTVGIVVGDMSYLAQRTDASKVSIPIGLSAVIQDLTYTSRSSSLASPTTVAYTTGGTAGAEVVTVAGGTVIQDITYYAAAIPMKSAPTVTYVGGGTAGSEVVTVVGNAISIQIQSGVSTATQVLAAFNASAPALALASATITGTAGHAQTTVAATIIACKNAISVQIQSGVSTATQVRAAVQASGAASALVSVAISGTAGNAQTAPVAATKISGGGATTSVGGNKFTTNVGSIGSITAVYDNGVLEQLGTKATTADLSQFGLSASIQMTYGTAGPITYEGAQWYTLQTVDAIIALLAQTAGVYSGASISPAIWPGLATGSAIIGAFMGSAYNPPWSVTGGSGTDATIAGANGVLTITLTHGGRGYGAICSAGGATAYGTFIFKINVVDGISGGQCTQYVYPILDSNGLTGGGAPTGNGYAVGFNPRAGTVTLYRVNGGSLVGLASASTTGTGAAIPFTNVSWTLTRNGAGVFTLIVNGQFVLTATDNTYSTAAYFGDSFISAGGATGTSTADISNISWQNNVTLSMPTFDSKTVWDAMQEIARLAGMDLGFDESGNLYFRSPNVSATPVIQLDQHAHISKVREWKSGVDRICNAAQITFSDFSATYDAAIAGDAHPTSEDIYGRMTPDGTPFHAGDGGGGGGIDFSSTLVVDDYPLAQAAAQILYQKRKLPARRGQLECKLLPWLQLGDVIGATILDDPKYAENYAGDPLQPPGYAGPNPQILAYQLPMKIIGNTKDPDNAKMLLTVEEVLS